MLIVSHDRYILNELVTEVIEVGQGHAMRYLGNYDDYLGKKAELDLASAGQAAAQAQRGEGVGESSYARIDQWHCAGRTQRRTSEK